EGPAGTRASAIQVEPVADSQESQRAQGYGCDQHYALEQRLPQRLDVENEEEVADRAEHERAEDGADGAARAAEERNAAEHDGGNRIQRIRAAVGGGRLAR